ncbi:MAG TPA: alkene reductase, partial [Humisphaera sp.]
VGYPLTPGLHSAAQVEGWKQVTAAVHNAGGRIFAQIWHVGRISHPSLQPGGALPVAPSAVKPAGQAVTFQGMQDFVTPRALETEEVPKVVADFAAAAANAKAAGFDGVEIHAANGYLFDQFLQNSTNQRTDRYGGSVENRARFLLETFAAVAAAWSADRVGVRLSPSGTFNDMGGTDRKAVFTHAVTELGKLNPAYLHVVQPTDADRRHKHAGWEELPIAYFRSIYKGVLIAAAGYDLASASQTVAAGTADAVAFGQLYLANPDLAERFKRNASLNVPDPSTFYGGTDKGYTDYPALSA